MAPGGASEKILSRVNCFGPSPKGIPPLAHTPRSEPLLPHRGIYRPPGSKRVGAPMFGPLLRLGAFAHVKAPKENTLGYQ